MLAEVFNYEERLQQAVRSFWKRRQESAGEPEFTRGACQENIMASLRDKNLDAFRDMIGDVVRKYAPKGSEVSIDGKMLSLPGDLRETNHWDMVILCRNRLLAAIELNSLCGPSFDTNADQCCKGAISSGYEFRAAQAATLFGPGASPFLGYFVLVEHAVGSRDPVSAKSPHFPTDEIFHSSSYQQRMKILCERMVEQQLYSCASVLVAPNDLKSGQSSHLSNQTSFRSLLTRLACHLVSEVDHMVESTSLLAGDLFRSFEYAETELDPLSDVKEISK